MEFGSRSPTSQLAMRTRHWVWSLECYVNVTCGKAYSGWLTVSGTGGTGEMVIIRTVELGGCYEEFIENGKRQSQIQPSTI